MRPGSIYTIFPHLVARHHPLLASVVVGFANWGVIAFGAAAVLLWVLAPPGGTDLWKLAGTAGLAAATLGLATNQVIIHLSQRPRPYQTHPLGDYPTAPTLHRSKLPQRPRQRRVRNRDRHVAAVSLAGGALFIRFAWELRHYPLDELPLTALALGLALVASIVYLASQQ